MNLINRTTRGIDLRTKEGVRIQLPTGEPVEVPDDVAKRVFVRNLIKQGDLELLSASEAKAALENQDQHRRQNVVPITTTTKMPSIGNAEIYANNRRPVEKFIEVFRPPSLLTPFVTSRTSIFHGLRRYSINPGASCLMDVDTFFSKDVQRAIESGNLEIITNTPPAAA